MSEANDVARDYLESWNRRDLAHMRDLMHPDQYTYTGGDGAPQQGPDAGMATAEAFAAAFPDGRIEDIRVHEAGDGRVVCEFVGRGTHTAPLMDIPATGRTLELAVCTILEVRDGKIVAEREYMDMLTVMQQLGVAPASRAA